MYSYAIVVNLVALNAVGFPNPQRVAWADELLMRARPHPLWHLRAIRAALPRPVQLAGDADHLLVPRLTYVLSMVLIALFIFRADRFRQFILGFILIMSLGLPTWGAFPAVTPSEAYRTIKVRSQVPYDIALEIAGPIIHLDHRTTFSR